MRPSLFESIKSHAGFLFSLLAIMWGIEILDFLLPFINLDRFGIRPRSVAGLPGIILSPILHLGFPHLISNSIPFLILGGMVMTSGARIFASVSAIVIILGGLSVWVFGGANTIHIGASGLIFGYLGFLLSRGIFERNSIWIFVSMGIMLAYGGMLYGVLPGQRGVSWIGHLSGFLAGIASARWLFARRPKLKIR